MKNSGSNINVAIYIPSYRPLPMGGAEIQAERLCNILNKKGVGIQIITPHAEGLPKHEVIDGIDIYRFKTILSRIQSLKRIKRQQPADTFSNTPINFNYSEEQLKRGAYASQKVGVREWMTFIDYTVVLFFLLFRRKKKYDLIQLNTTTWLAGVFALVSKLVNIPLLIKESTMDGLSQMHLTPAKNYFRQLLVRNAWFVAISEVIENNLLRNGVQQSRIFRIPNGIEVGERMLNHKHERWMRFDCLFVGNLYQQPAKGIDVLLQAWGNVIKQFPHATLKVVGAGNIVAYRNYVDELGLSNSVSFTGKVNPLQYYQSCSLFILPSRREGMSNALIEAMSFGMPVVVTNISGSIDLVDDGINGYIVDPGNAEQLTSAIIKILSDHPFRKLCETRNEERIKRMCDIKTVADKYIQGYNKMVSG